jgi:hypothetical protein
MDLQEAFAIAIKVIADWRVIFIAIAVMLAWAALRYVGSVYHKRPRASPRPPAAPPPPKATGSAQAASPERGSSGEGMVQ